MATSMNRDTTDTSLWVLSLEEQSKTLKTKDTYVDGNIKINVKDAVLGGGTGELTAEVSTTDTTYTTTTDTGYSIPIKATATVAESSVTVNEAGWVDDNDSVTIEGGSETDEATLYIKAGELQSVAGNAPVATAGFTGSDTYLTSTNTGYKITATADAAATSKSGVDAVATAGWVPADAAVTVTTPAATQATSDTYIKAGALKNANGGAVTATAGLSTNYFKDGTSGKYAVTATADASSADSTTGVTTAGWIPTTATATVTGQTATQDTETKYIKEGSVANSATASVDYTDISESAGALVSGGYLYINEGYQDNTKISLAKLVPDGSNVKGAEAYLYKTKTAYDNDGVLVTGSMDKAEISASVTSADATANISSITPAYNATSGKYDVTGTGDISGTANVSAAVTGSGLAVSATDNADSGKYAGLGVTSATASGDISGTASLSNVTLDAAVLQASKTADGEVKPVIADAAATGTNVAKHSAITTSAPSTGKYVAVNTSAIAASTTVTSSVKSDGYADTTNTNKPETTVTRGASAADTVYIAITAGSVADAKEADGAVKPVIKVATGNNASTGTLTTSKPSSGNYVAVDTSAISASTKVTTTVTEGYVTAADNTDITVTRGADAAAIAYIPLTAATHSDTKGDLTNTNAAATVSTEVKTKANGAVAGVLSSAPSSGDYIKISGSGAQTAAGSVSQDVTCAVSVGYVGTAINNTTTVSASTDVTITNAADKYIKIYDGSIL